ncbi:MAG: hypothetical protein ACREFU_02900 [Acetobacteraceae bacterium]
MLSTRRPNRLKGPIAAALWLGRMLDRLGVVVVAFSTPLAAASMPLGILDGFRDALAGIVPWGIGIGAQGPLLKSALTAFVAPERRAQTRRDGRCLLVRRVPAVPAIWAVRAHAAPTSGRR